MQTKTILTIKETKLDPYLVSILIDIPTNQGWPMPAIITKSAIKDYLKTATKELKTDPEHIDKDYIPLVAKLYNKLQTKKAQYLVIE